MDIHRLITIIIVTFAIEVEIARLFSLCVVGFLDFYITKHINLKEMAIIGVDLNFHCKFTLIYTYLHKSSKHMVRRCDGPKRGHVSCI